MKQMKRIIVGVSGASGAILAAALLRTLRRFQQVETHLVLTANAERTLELETDLALAEFLTLADIVYSNTDLAAKIASGSFSTAGMAVVPCSMKTLAGIVHGYSENLLLRAADVCLKEQRKLVLAPRETPLSRLHLENMLKAAQYGAVIIPPMLTFYHHPADMDDQVRHFISKILPQFGLEEPGSYAWPGANI